MTAQALTYKKKTKNLEIAVTPHFLEQQSDPDRSLFVWAYHIVITNRDHERWKLTSRYWEITDAHGLTQTVEGEGVVGEQPLIHPGTSFEYTSGVPLKTPCGMMTGHYIMLCSNGEQAKIGIPLFSLDSPFDKRQAN